jgi:hypothetical protein
MRLASQRQVAFSSLKKNKLIKGTHVGNVLQKSRDVREHAALCSKEAFIIHLKAHFPRMKSLRWSM